MLLDTNAVLYFLGGDKTLFEFIEGKQLYISVITEMELLSFKGISEMEFVIISEFIEDVRVLDISLEVKRLAISLRQSTRLKLPDCIISATSMAMNLPLVTSDKAFRNIEGLNVIFYEK